MTYSLVSILTQYKALFILVKKNKIRVASVRFQSLLNTRHCSSPITEVSSDWRK